MNTGRIVCDVALLDSLASAATIVVPDLARVLVQQQTPIAPCFSLAALAYLNHGSGTGVTSCKRSCTFVLQMTTFFVVLQECGGDPCFEYVIYLVVLDSISTKSNVES